MTSLKAACVDNYHVNVNHSHVVFSCCYLHMCSVFLSISIGPPWRGVAAEVFFLFGFGGQVGSGEPGE